MVATETLERRKFLKPEDFARFENLLQDMEDIADIKKLFIGYFDVTEKHLDFLTGLGGARKLREFYYEVIKFDLQYGTKTATLIMEDEYANLAQETPASFAADLSIVKRGVKHRSSLTSSIVDGFNESARILRDRGYDPRQASVFDLGSGEGKVISIAASRKKNFNFPFKKAVGVDYYKDVIEIAEKNIHSPALQADCEKVRFIFADAAKFREFNGLNIVYMYNPFDKDIITKVEKNLRDYGGKSLVVYNKPLYRDIFEEKGWLVEHELAEPKEYEAWRQDKWTSILSHGFE